MYQLQELANKEVVLGNQSRTVTYLAYNKIIK